MRALFALAIPLVFTQFATTTLAYYNDCKGSSYFPDNADCIEGIRAINVTSDYEPSDEFSVRSCMIQYRTDGRDSQKISGQIIRNVAKRIMEGCLCGRGSLGTGNCETCHVTMNFRDGHGGMGTLGSPEPCPDDIRTLDEAIDKPMKE